MKKRTNVLLYGGIAMLVGATLFTGCATMNLQTQAKLTKTVFIDHSQLKNKTIYLQVTNTSGENIDLKSSLKSNLEKKGYKIVDNSKDAEYGLLLNVLFANNLKEANAIKNGLAAGTTAGGMSAISGGGGTDSLIIGASAALAGAIVGKAFEDEVFRAVVDITVRDYSLDEIKTTRTQHDTGGRLHNVARAGNVNQLAGTLGNKNGGADMQSGVSEAITTESTRNYEDHRTRAFIEATKMNLKLSEALPIMQAKITSQISNLF